MKTLKYFIFVMKAPKTVYGGITGKLTHFRKALKNRANNREGGAIYGK